MNKQRWLLWFGWLSMFFAAPLFMDYAVDQLHEGLTFSENTRYVEAAMPHGKTVGTLALSGLYVWLMYHFHWQNQVPGQKW